MWCNLHLLLTNEPPQRNLMGSEVSTLYPRAACHGNLLILASFPFTILVEICVANVWPHFVAGTSDCDGAKTFHGLKKSFTL